MLPELSGFDVAAFLAKAAGYAATLGAAGTAFFLVYGQGHLSASQRAHLRRHIYVLAAAALFTTALRIALLSGSMSDELTGMVDRSYVSMILSAGEGRASAARIAGLATLCVILAGRKRVGGLATFAALLAASSFAWVGHTHASPQGWPPWLLALHLGCAAFWLGALYPLWRVARDGDASQLAPLAARFGRIALLWVSLLVLVGVILLANLLPSSDALWQSNYGRLAMVKITLVVALLAAAAFNKLQLTPRLLRGEPSALAMLRRSIGIEMTLGAVILLVTALFTSVTGPDA